MLNTSSLGDRARDEERAEMIRREEALERWRTPEKIDTCRSVADALELAIAQCEKAARAEALASKAEPDSDFASGGSYL